MSLAPLMDSTVVAELLHCSVRTVEDHARNGTLPALKIGDGWIFPSEALLKAVNRMAEEGAEKRSRPTAAAAVLHKAMRKGPPDLSRLLA